MSVAALARGYSDAARQRSLKALLSAAEFINKGETHLGAALCAGLDKSNLRFDVSTKAAHTLNDSYLSTQLLQLLDVKVSRRRPASPLRPRSYRCLQPCTAHLAAPLPARCPWVPLPPAGPPAPCIQWQKVSLSERQDAILQRLACVDATALDWGYKLTRGVNTGEGSSKAGLFLVVGDDNKARRPRSLPPQTCTAPSPARSRAARPCHPTKKLT